MSSKMKQARRQHIRTYFQAVVIDLQQEGKLQPMPVDWSLGKTVRDNLGVLLAELEDDVEEFLRQIGVNVAMRSGELGRAFLHVGVDELVGAGLRRLGGWLSGAGKKR